jgi:hypothetical protein
MGWRLADKTLLRNPQLETVSGDNPLGQQACDIRDEVIMEYVMAEGAE